MAVAVFCILVAGAVVLGIRAAGLWWGLPNSEHYFSYHPDEIFQLQPALFFAAGDWNPHFFNYGTLYIYLVGIPAVVLGVLPDAAQFPAGLAPLYLLGRIITALLGAGTILLLYLAVRPEHLSCARMSALLLAICPLHVVNSYYATVDVPATFFITLAFLLALRGSQRPTVRTGTLAGLAVGCAAATKYNAGLFVIPALLAPRLARPRKWCWRWCLGVAGGAIIGFIIGCPFFWTPEFRRGLLFELRHAQAGGTLAFVGTGSGWTYHLLHGLPVGLGYALLMAVLLGVVAAARGESRVTRVSLLWVVLYLVVIGFSRERFIRYLVPLAPFVCVLAAAVLVWLEELPKGRFVRAAVSSLPSVVLMLTFFYMVGEVTVFCVDPRDEAWERIAPRVTVSKQHPRVGVTQAVWFFHPPVSPYNAGPLFQALFRKWNEESGERVVITGWNAEKLKEERPEYFFLSDLESRDLLRLRRPDALGFVAALDALYEKREEFFQDAFWPWRTSWLAPPRGWAPPDWLYPSPVITMYCNPR